MGAAAGAAAAAEAEAVLLSEPRWMQIKPAQQRGILPFPPAPVVLVGTFGRALSAIDSDRVHFRHKFSSKGIHENLLGDENTRLGGTDPGRRRRDPMQCGQ